MATSSDPRAEARDAVEQAFDTLQQLAVSVNYQLREKQQDMFGWLGKLEMTDWAQLGEEDARKLLSEVKRETEAATQGIDLELHEDSNDGAKEGEAASSGRRRNSSRLLSRSSSAALKEEMLKEEYKAKLEGWIQKTRGELRTATAKKLAQQSPIPVDDLHDDGGRGSDFPEVDEVLQEHYDERDANLNALLLASRDVRGWSNQQNDTTKHGNMLIGAILEKAFERCNLAAAKSILEDPALGGKEAWKFGALDIPGDADKDIRSNRQSFLHLTFSYPTKKIVDVQRQTEIVQYLATFKVNSQSSVAKYLDLKDRFGRSALILAIDHPDEVLMRPVFDLLLDSKADPLVADNNGRTALHFACFWKHVSSAKRLIERFADLNAVDEDGHTPLAVAAIRGSVPVAFLLLQNGARTDIEDNDGLLCLSHSLMDHGQKPEAEQKRIMSISPVAEQKRKMSFPMLHLETLTATGASSGDPKETEEDKRRRRAKQKYDEIRSRLRQCYAGKHPKNLPQLQERPDHHDRREKISLAFVNNGASIEAAIQDDSELYEGSVMQHYLRLEVDLKCAYFNPKDDFANDKFRDALIQQAIDVQFQDEVLPSALKDLCIWMVTLLLMFLWATIAAGELEPRAYYVDQSLDAVFNDNWDDPINMKEFADVGNADELWAWIKGPFLDSVYREEADFVGNDGTVAKSSSFGNTLVGSARIRTIQVATETCADSDAAGFTCFTGQVSGNSAAIPDGMAEALPWIEHRSTESHVPDIHGLFASYPDGGLTFVLPRGGNATQTEAMKKQTAERLEAMESSGLFINLNARAFIAEFTMYNADVRVFTPSYFLIEMPREGFYQPTFRYSNFCRISYVSAGDFKRMGLSIVVVILLLRYLHGELSQMSETWEEPAKENSLFFDDTIAKERKARKKLYRTITGDDPDRADNPDNPDSGNRPVLAEVLLPDTFDAEDGSWQYVVLDKCRKCLHIVIRPYFYEGE